MTPVLRALFSISVGHVGGHLAVHEVLQVVSAGDDSQLVPLAFL